jgi:hypothetical protein
MEERKKLDVLCKKIKRMIPSDKIRDDATEPFTNFLISLKEKGISVEEIESIRRAYNYFNHIVSFHIQNVASDKDESNENSNIDESNIDESNIDSIKVQKVSNPPKIPKSPLLEDGEKRESVKIEIENPVLSDEKMIQLLLSLYKLENKRMAIKDMKTISSSVLKSIPNLKLEWTNKRIAPEKLNTLVGRLGYQTEFAKLLNEIIPESDELLDATTKVLAIAQNEEAKANQNTNETMSSKNLADSDSATKGGTIESIKEQTRLAQKSIAEKRVEEIVETFPTSILEAQQKVIDEVIKLESIL